jgi:hypothetical protein
MAQFLFEDFSKAIAVEQRERTIEIVKRYM